MCVTVHLHVDTSYLSLFSKFSLCISFELYYSIYRKERSLFYCVRVGVVIKILLNNNRGFSFDERLLNAQCIRAEARAVER